MPRFTLSVLGWMIVSRFWTSERRRSLSVAARSLDCMGKLIDLTGQRFGRLTVIERTNQSPGEEVRWLCKCSCGKTVEVDAKSLRKGKTKSCGCYRKDATSSRFRKHGATVRDKKTPDYRIYSIWRGMLDRCYRQGNHRYKLYGGRGISVCDEWHDFATFQRWAMENGYKDGLTIDRIDNQKGYSPENCQWATPLEQTRNRRITRRITFMGHTMTVREWASMIGVPYEILNQRLTRGWNIERALTEPVHEEQKRTT